MASEASGRVIRIDAESGRVVNAINVGNGPGAVAFGEGAVWATNRQDGTVSRIDPATDAVTETVRVGSGPTAIAAGEGAVWVANGADGALARLDPDTRQVTETIELGGSLSALAIADGSVWTTALASQASHRGGTLRLWWPLPEPVACRCADPILYTSVHSWWLASLAYDGLVTYRRIGGAAGARLVGNLATEVPEPTDDGRTYVFELRPRIRFSNGATVRPEHFRHSLERFLRLNSRDSSLSYFDGIVGADRCGPRSCDLSEGIETDPQARTITIHLRAPDAEFLHKLTLPQAIVVPSNSPVRFARQRPLPGTGPYRVANFDPARGGHLIRNPYFRVWSQDARPDGFADELAIDVGAGIDAQLATVRRGEADMVDLSKALFQGTLRPARIRALAVQYGGLLHSAPEPQLDYMYMNQGLPPFDDARVRRAVNYAVDRAQVVELAGGTQAARPTCQVLPPGFPGYRPYCPHTVNPNPAGTWSGPDLAKARRLIEGSGTSGARVRIWTEGTKQPVGRYFESLLRRLGYRTSLRVFPPSTYYEVTYAPQEPVNLWWFGWLTDHLAPSGFIQPIFNCETFGPRSKLRDDFSPWCDRGIDAQMDRALAQQGSDPTAANELWEGVDRRLAEEAAAVPLFNRKRVVLVSDRVENVQFHPLWGVLMDQLWVK